MTFGLFLLLGCRGAQYVGSNVQPGGAGEGLFAPQPSTGNGRFETAVSSLREQVQLLGAAPDAVDDASARRAVRSLADAIENVPDPQGVDVTDAAGIMRTDYGNVVGATGATASGQLREALMVVAGAMTLLGRGPYAREPAVARRVSAFEHAAAAVNPGEGIKAQPQVVVHALVAAGAALGSLERASGIAPAPVVSARTSASAVAPQQPPGVTEAQQPPPALPVSPHPSPFAAALAIYSAAVDRLAVAPPDQVPVALRKALDALADVLQVMPGSAATIEELALMRSFASDMTAAPSPSGAQGGFTKHVLDLADDILSLTAKRSFGQVPPVADEVSAMRRQVAAIDGERALGPQLLTILGALEAAEDTLRTMAVPRPPR